MSDPILIVMDRSVSDDHSVALAVQSHDGGTQTVLGEIEAALVTENDRLRAVNAELLAACKTRVDEWHADMRNFHRKEPPSLSMTRAAIAQAEKGITHVDRRDP